MNKRIVIGLIAFGICASSAMAQDAFFPTKAQIALLGQDAQWSGLRSSCAAGLRVEGHPFADFSPAPHYTASGPRKEGDDAPEPTLHRESLAIYRLSLCFEISKDMKYSTKAEDLLNGWANTTVKIGTDQGKDSFNFYFPYALMGAYLLREDAGWKDGKFAQFVRDIVLPANNSDKPNNHANWGVLLMASVGTYLRDDAVVTRARDRWLELMRSQVAEDGSLPLEICRSDTSNWCGGKTKGIKGMSYTHYALQPTVMAAEIFKNGDKSVYDTPEGALLCKAYRRAASWTLHPDTFPYYASNDGKLIGLGNVDYFYILQQRCPTADGAAVLNQYGETVADPWLLRVMYGKQAR